MAEGPTTWPLGKSSLLLSHRTRGQWDVKLSDSSRDDMLALSWDDEAGLPLLHKQRSPTGGHGERAVRRSLSSAEGAGSVLPPPVTGPGAWE